LVEILSECGVVDNDRLESLWRAECSRLNEKSAEPAPAAAQPKKTQKAKRKAKRKVSPGD
jgi:hypothetical protein